ncbi:hypothetical protein IMSAGC007_04777 [Lachnospiraceae bacterium]|nr:hypothetical protein IMSAGC007_04777 [Lachnospiraceae bacterium]
MIISQRWSMNYQKKVYPKEKVHMQDVELIFSEESMKAFGLTENAG